jgi:hypothetical protein
MRSVCHCRAGGLVTFLKPGSKKANEPESGVNAVMALVRACPGPSSRWTSVLVSENYRNGSLWLNDCSGHPGRSRCAVAPSLITGSRRIQAEFSPPLYICSYMRSKATGASNGLQPFQLVLRHLLRSWARFGHALLGTRVSRRGYAFGVKCIQGVDQSLERRWTLGLHGERIIEQSEALLYVPRSSV